MEIGTLPLVPNRVGIYVWWCPRAVGVKCGRDDKVRVTTVHSRIKCFHQLETHSYMVSENLKDYGTR